MTKEQKTFGPKVREELQYYVYRLIDPRNGETFYVGKGRGNRVFAHVDAALKSKAENLKLDLIREIRAKGEKVTHVIHRHGMDSDTALIVEAALIDAYPETANIMSGHGSKKYGCMSSQDVIKRYAAKKVKLKHDVLIININQSISEERLKKQNKAKDSHAIIELDEKDIYEAVKCSWKVSIKNAEKVDYVLAVEYGIIVGIFIAEKWVQATEEVFGDRADVRRKGFIEGDKVDEKTEKYYLHKRIPDELMPKGAQNPIRYEWLEK